MLKELGITGIIILIIFIGLIPFIATILVGTTFATMLGFTGIVWWAFVILFFLVIAAILSHVQQVTQ